MEHALMNDNRQLHKDGAHAVGESASTVGGVYFRRTFAAVELGARSVVVAPPSSQPLRYRHPASAHRWRVFASLRRASGRAWTDVWRQGCDAAPPRTLCINACAVSNL